MKRGTRWISGLVLACCTVAHAEWYKVDKVLEYNVLNVSKLAESQPSIKVRAENLDRIEYIHDSKKVLLGGKEAKELAKEMLGGQIVWIENLRDEGGMMTGSISVSYEQVMNVFMKHRLAGGYVTTPDVRAQLVLIYRKMLDTLDANNPILGKKSKTSSKASSKTESKSSSPASVVQTENAYGNEYTRAMFVYECLSWYKETGQFLPVHVQKLFVKWLKSFQSDTIQRAKYAEQKLRDLMKHAGLYRDFLFED